MLYTGKNVVDGTPVMKEFLLDDDDPTSKFVGCDSISETYILFHYEGKYHVMSDTCPERKFSSNENDGDIGSKEIKTFFKHLDAYDFGRMYNDKYEEHLLEDIPEDIMLAFQSEIKEMMKEYQDILDGNVVAPKEEKWEYNKIPMYDKSIVEEMIAKVDKINFAKIISAINGLELRGDSNNQIVDNMLRLWAMGKSHIYVAMGRNLRVSSTVDIEKTESIIKSERNSVAEDFPQYKLYIRGLHYSAIQNNKIDDYCDGVFHQNIGVKVGKLFHQWYRDKDLDIALSKLIDNKNITRNIHVSIDPIDILLMSNNNNGWQSCQRILKGEYRTGAVVELYSNTSLVSFATSSEKESEIQIGKYKVKAFNKCWRQLVYFNNDTGSQLYAREYPNSHAEQSRGVRLLFESVLAKHYGHKDVWKKKQFDGSIQSSLSSYHYNDIKHGGTKGTLIFFNETDRELDKKFQSGKTYKSRYICPSCGKNHNPEGASSHHCGNGTQQVMEFEF